MNKSLSYDGSYFLNVGVILWKKQKAQKNIDFMDYASIILFIF